MQKTATGYVRPRSTGPLPQEFDAAFSQICTGRTIRQEANGRTYDPSWGPLVTVEVGNSTDPAVRFRGSSGGIISTLAIHLLESGKVDFILHTRTDPTDPIGNVTAPSFTRDDILAAAGSRYAPSSPLADLERYLAEGRKFAFIGKPCDIATLRAMARRDPRIDALIPYKLSFFCAGIPGRKGAHALLDRMGVEPDQLARFDYRGNGWPGPTRAERTDGSAVTFDYASSWGQVLSRHLQFRCKICPDGTGEFADIAAADAWYGQDGYPDFDERDGRSLVIARTAEGRALLDEALGQARIELEPLPITDIALMQPYQRDRKRVVLARSLAMLLLGRRRPRFTGLQLLRNTLRTPPLFLLRNMLGTLKRLPKTPRGA
ncbi:Coenzyme F420 hydrogenase/dehydrogenase, beta subunit C-terminal domain [Novosphingobium sp. 1949]|uniref:Coenzyme F420 hydrogenase/dehydrogenase, beta subunit C-terminal domain n=1 Tax=Novosphingobium organovorum TaxID=2930092 RepID=A0ABT0BDK7_9SPHN|nr:Coenzyme F420 hydrogenase/dehydrogenase, beta subunit C-terminal domain [Novosphingobium organovorum]MCJ2183125.1 Coenzyme F420 hydrogenase/dehydrogenase, beta subunit C-terminal domain [Novosphingobium organovorum]